MLMADWQSLTHNTRRAFEWKTLQMVWRHPGGSRPGHRLRSRHGQCLKASRCRASGVIRNDAVLAENRLRFSASGRAGRVESADAGPDFFPGAAFCPYLAGQNFPTHCNRQRAWSEC